MSSFTKTRTLPYFEIRLQWITSLIKMIASLIEMIASLIRYASIERRLQQLGAQILPPSMHGASNGHAASSLILSIQYFDAARRTIVESGPNSDVAEMLKASSWRVLVLG